ncbi:serine hydrolase FSH [Hyaloscypha finlandica]|nr:serine hydrolase FSH [Hyaloscypha sp. PMI_1271]KAH8776116.1 serine hydrolase FSH [Hyaloscypha finlandica]
MAPLPRVACFHGGGSSASIFAAQCDTLQKKLSSTFEFVFFDAPYERDAGPGVLPFFSYEEFGPYRTWFFKNESGAEVPDGRKDDGGGEGGIERVLRMIREKGEGGEWVGCMGFSQGTRIVGGLLLHQQKRREMGFQREEGEVDFKFGVLCMGSFAPMLSDLTAAMSLSGGPDLITIPTLHLHGTKDVNYANGKKQLAAYYDRKTARLLEIDYHHAMPWFRADLMKFVDGIESIYEDSQDDY